MNGLVPRNQLLLIAVALLLTTASVAQTLTITGEVRKPLTLQSADLKALPHLELSAADRDGKEHRYAGIPLITLLTQAGASTGQHSKEKT